MTGLSLGIIGSSLLGGLLSLGFGLGLSIRGWQPSTSLNLSAVDIRPQWESAWLKNLIADDPVAKTIVSNYLSGLSSAGYLLDEQGVWVAAGQFPMAQHQGNTRKPAASITKVATTLAALETWGPAYQFETLVGWRGRFENGVIEGDLIIEGSHDPLFVWEEAIALGNALQQVGVRRVTGDLIIAGNFTMNFEPDAGTSGQMLKQAMNAADWDDPVLTAYQNLPQTPQPAVQIDGQVKVSSVSLKAEVSGWLVRHGSLPLVAVLKAMNIYSNNAMAEQIAQTLGGPEVVMSKVEAVGVSANEISLTNGSGLGETNQMSPRAAVIMLQEIQKILQVNRLTISDIFPIVGTDGGTVQDRNLPSNAVVKTGTLAVVSALAGAVPTEKKGIVWFSLLNYGSDLDGLRMRQDQVISAIEQQWGKAAAVPVEMRTTVVIGQGAYRFGDQQRNQPISAQSQGPVSSTQPAN